MWEESGERPPRAAAFAASALGDAMVDAAHKPDLAQLKVHLSSFGAEIKAQRARAAAKGGTGAAAPTPPPLLLYDGSERWKMRTALHMASLARKVKRSERAVRWASETQGLGGAYADVVEYICAGDHTRCAVSRQDVGGRTPMHLAAWRGHTNLVRILIRYDGEPREEGLSGVRFASSPPSLPLPPSPRPADLPLHASRAEHGARRLHARRLRPHRAA